MMFRIMKKVKSLLKTVSSERGSIKSAIPYKPRRYLMRGTAVHEEVEQRTQDLINAVAYFDGLF